MPIYEYGCDDCGKVFEYIQRMADAPKAVCESCGGALQRLISRSAFHLKGGGWYKDLYSSTKPAESGTKSGGDGAASTTSESKSTGESKGSSSPDSGASSSSDKATKKTAGSGD